MWHRHPDSSDDAMIPPTWPVTLARDDLIRLVVGMQWVDACMAFHVLTSAMSSFGVSGDVVVTMDQELVDELRPASTIVDEWLGVR